MLPPVVMIWFMNRQKISAKRREKQPTAQIFSVVYIFIVVVVGLWKMWISVENTDIIDVLASTEGCE